MKTEMCKKTYNIDESIKKLSLDWYYHQLQRTENADGRSNARYDICAANDNLPTVSSQLCMR